MSILILRSAAAVEEPPGDGPTFDIFFDDFEDRTAANNISSLNSSWTSKGYTDLSGDFRDVDILDRSGMPAELLAVIPAGKTKAVLFNLNSSDHESRIVWEDFPADTREVYISWIEWRPNANMGGEKFLRIGNRVGEGRGHDIIITMSEPDENFTLLDNSDVGQYPWGEGFNAPLLDGWPGGLAHFEVRLLLSTGTNADGVCQMWFNGDLHANWTGIRMHQDATAAARDIGLAELAGWSSGTGTYPIRRYYLAFGVSTTRQGLYTLDDVL
jgi:hypothetical protein